VRPGDAGKRRRLPTIAVALALALPASAAAAPPAPEPFRANDPGGFLNIIPPGQNGHANAADIAAFQLSGTRPPNASDQLKRYAELVFAAPGLQAGQLGDFYKDASFGVPEGQEAARYSPRDDVTIQRDRAVGVPHIYGTTRAGTMFGAGYVGAEDRLFFMDVLRHVGRAELSSFVGGSQGNREMDREQWRIAPYTEADLERQFEQLDDLYGADGRTVQDDVRNYVAGINRYIAEATAMAAPTPNAKNGQTPVQKLPGEYGAITPNTETGVGRPEPWKPTDLVATASLVGGIFGKGGGKEVDSSLVLLAAQAKFGPDAGRSVFGDFRNAEDPEAPTTVEKAFPYLTPAADVDKRSLAIPDGLDAVEETKVVARAGRRGRRGGVLGRSRRDAFPPGASNALVVSGAESESGRPVAVFGPQTGYFAPQILLELDMHAPASNAGPAIDARGVAFPGVNLYIQLGRGRDYAWSATSAGQDIIDTFALELCEPNGSPATLRSAHYRYRGKCLPFEVLTRTNRWVPNAADQTPPGTETLRAERTALGLVTHRGTLDGGKTPVAYAALRSTYLHEIDSAVGFLDYNTPDRMENAAEFQRAASRIGFTFNWFYADDKDIAYFNSGNNPQRAPGIDHDFPVRACPGAEAKCEFEWRNWDPERFTASYTPFEEHPQAINPPYLTSWNNKQAPGHRAADDNYAYGPVQRSEPLDDRIKPAIAGEGKITPAELTDAMADAGTVDLRGDKVLPFLLRVVGDPGDPALAEPLRRLGDWQRTGAHRRDRDRDGTYEHSEAVKVMDAWWPRLVKAQFEPILGTDLYDRIRTMIELDNSPNGDGAHLGSAYIAGWYSFVEKDLRMLLGDEVRGRNSRSYCGDGNLAACREVLLKTLREAVAADRAVVYRDAVCSSSRNAPLDDQLCFDAIEQSPVGAITHPLINWQNRPTFQQVVEVGGATAAAAPTPAPAAASTPAPAATPRPITAPTSPASDDDEDADGGRGGEDEDSDDGRTRESETGAQPAERSPGRSELPFTGFAAIGIGAAGLGLLAAGAALRRRTRRP